MSQVGGLPSNCTRLSPIRRGFGSGFVNYKKWCTRLAAASDTVYQLLAHGRWFSPGTPASTTTKTGRHDIAEILLKVTLNTINQIICFHLTFLLEKFSVNPQASWHGFTNPFFNFLFTYLFSIKFLSLFIISSLFTCSCPYSLQSYMCRPYIHVYTCILIIHKKL